MIVDPNELVTVRDVYGDTHQVLGADLASDKIMLTMFTKGGKSGVELIHRPALLAKTFPGNAWHLHRGNIAAKESQ